MDGASGVVGAGAVTSQEDTRSADASGNERPEEMAQSQAQAEAEAPRPVEESAPPDPNRGANVNDLI
ncbi:MAG: hypothetical protein JRC92_08115 [Deltaproteobacteria bacterium]|nr:hypothetical protein [Deltaproteobacteria bacterium]